MEKLMTISVLFTLYGVQSLPFRSYAPRSVPGRIKESSDPLSIRDYFSNYYATMRQHQQPQYGLPEYEPQFLESLIYRNPKPVTPERLSQIVPYLPQPSPRDYSYDYATPTTSFTDEDIWYDDPEANEYASIADKYNQNAALLQLFIDHLNGKYSLEDLETLEREAAIEANNENQLQALMAKKKSSVPVMNFAPSRMIPFRRGQKEEPLMLPSTSLRKPIFTTNLPEKKKAPQTENVKNKFMKQKEARVQEKTTPKPVQEAKQSSTSTMEPYVRTAYESLRRFLDKERMRKQAIDENTHVQQKRFISDPQSLTQQLAGLKKTLV